MWNQCVYCFGQTNSNSSNVNVEISLSVESGSGNSKTLPPSLNLLILPFSLSQHSHSHLFPQNLPFPPTFTPSFTLCALHASQSNRSSFCANPLNASFSEFCFWLHYIMSHHFIVRWQKKKIIKRCSFS